MKLTWLDLTTLAIVGALSWWITDHQGWDPWWAVVLAVMVWSSARRVLKYALSKETLERRATAAKLKEIQARNEREAARVQDEMRATARDAEQLAAEAEALAAEAQVRPSPANPNTRIRHTVNVRSSNRSGVTLNGIHNPQGVWIVTRELPSRVTEGLDIHRGSIITFDGTQYHGQDGVLEISTFQIERGVQTGWLRLIEAVDAPGAVIDESMVGAFADFGTTIQGFGDAMRRQVRRSPRTASVPEPEEEPRRRSSWERLDDDDF